MLIDYAPRLKARDRRQASRKRCITYAQDLAVFAAILAAFLFASLAPMY